MGTCKEEMKPKNDDKGIFGRILSKKKGDIQSKAAQTFADLLIEIEGRLGTLVTTKQAELKTEPNRQSYNQKQLARLEAMAFHLDQIIELAAEYSQDN